MLERQSDGRYAEVAPTDCEACSLAWPFDGTIGRVLVGTAVGGRRTYTCQGCGHTTGGPADGGYTLRAPDAHRARPDSGQPR